MRSPGRRLESIRDGVPSWASQMSFQNLPQYGWLHGVARPLDKDSRESQRAQTSSLVPHQPKSSRVTNKWLCEGPVWTDDGSVHLPNTCKRATGTPDTVHCSWLITRKAGRMHQALR